MHHASLKAPGQPLYMLTAQSVARRGGLRTSRKARSQAIRSPMGMFHGTEGFHGPTSRGSTERAPKTELVAELSVGHEAAVPLVFRVNSL